ncbi:YceG family protein [Succinimonas sp.]|uniref:YceG family protein n=1 Tax=Succinimonas sp. TaxID=1936151 RepID=UPI0038655DB7
MLFKRAEISKPEDYFLELSKRRERSGYFCRLNGYSQGMRDFIRRYYEAASERGVIIEGKLNNPDSSNLAYYNEMMGSAFQMDVNFIDASLAKWLPRMTAQQRSVISQAIFQTLDELRKAGKNENMLKNAYIKFMCWFYYRFEKIIAFLGAEQLPKILYEGSIGSNELLFMNVLFLAGCDVLLLQYGGDARYLEIDPASERSRELKMPDLAPFPEGFSLKEVRKDIQDALVTERLYGKKPRFSGCVNAWITGQPLEELRKAPASRGSEPGFFYSCFLRINGVEDRSAYLNDLFKLHQDLAQEKRRIVVVNGKIPLPAPDDINQIRHGSYRNVSQLIRDLSGNLSFIPDGDLRDLANRAFTEILLEEAGSVSQAEPMILNRLTTRAVYMLCWLRIYSRQLFSSWKMPEIACFIFMGGAGSANEAAFLRLLARMPADVVILCPNLSRKCCLQDRLLYEINYEDSLEVNEFPTESGGFRAGTAAYHAERDLDKMMYEDTGVYRSQQYGKAATVVLQTMYEEIAVLWDQELKYRPNFTASGDSVSIPVIFAKVDGVKNGDTEAYWEGIAKMVTPDTMVVKNIPCIAPGATNPIRKFAPEFFRNGKLQKAKIKAHKAYRYGFLRENMQDYLLDKLELLLDQKIIKGTFENGAEYVIIATVLNLDRKIMRMIQRFDFTKKNPKLIYIVTGETVLSQEDAIVASFLNQVGFDVVFFVPTGYQCVEQHLSRSLIDEHQAGEYVFDLRVPDLKKLAGNRSFFRTVLDFFFK